MSNKICMGESYYKGINVKLCHALTLQEKLVEI